MGSYVCSGCQPEASSDSMDVLTTASDVSLCVTLVSLFDFSAKGQVSKTDWERGTSTLLLGELGKDGSLWDKLLNLYDPLNSGSVQLDRVKDVRLTDRMPTPTPTPSPSQAPFRFGSQVLPIDPRISVLLQQLVHAVAGCREFVAQSTAKAAKAVELRSQRAVINMRKRMLQPIFEGWLEVVRSERQMRSRAARYMRSSTVARAWRSWVELLEASQVASQKRARMGKLLRRMMQRGVARALTQVSRGKQPLVGGAHAQWVGHMWKADVRSGSSPNVPIAAALLFAQWIDVVEEQHRMCAVLRRAMSPVSRAWNQWVGVAQETARLRGIIRRGMDGGLSKGFNTWVCYLQGERRCVALRPAPLQLSPPIGRLLSRVAAEPSPFSCICAGYAALVRKRWVGRSFVRGTRGSTAPAVRRRASARSFKGSCAARSTAGCRARGLAGWICARSVLCSPSLLAGCAAVGCTPRFSGGYRGLMSGRGCGSSHGVCSAPA